MRSADLAVYEHQSSYNRVFYSDDWKTITGYDINQGNTYPRLYPGNEAKGTVSGIANGSNNYYPQSRYLTDMSYLRLKNVTVGYTLPKEWTRKAFIEKARIYFSGSNLFLLYKGSDPVSYTHLLKRFIKENNVDFNNVQQISILCMHAESIYNITD